MATGALAGELLGHEKIVYDRALSPDGSQVATASYDNTVRQWSAETGAPIEPVIRFDLRPVVVAFDPVAPRLATGSRPGTRLVTSPWLLDDGRLVPKPR